MARSPAVPTANSDLERRRLLYVLSEALEKVSRLRQILKRQQTFLRAEQAEDRPANAIEALKDNLDKHCQMILGNSDRIASLLDGKALNETARAAVEQSLAILVARTLQVHELMLLLPREAAHPQASSVLRNCFGSQLSASIVLTNLFTSYEYRFEDILARINVEQEELGTLSQGSGVLCQAFADKDNPLAWAVLAHEYGHTLNELKSISRDLVHGENSQKPDQNLAKTVEADPGADVIAETVADFIAANVLGPASLMPILFIEMMVPNLSKKWAGHPPTPLRVRLVREYLKTLGVSTSDFEAVFDAYSYDYSRKLQKMKSDDRETIEKTAAAAEKLLSPLADTIATKVNALGLRQFEERNGGNARTLQGTLASRLPIASRRRHSEKTIFGKLNSIKRGIAPEEAYRILSDLDEVPAATSEILTAGWLYRLATFEKELKKTFQRRTSEMPQPVSDNSGDSIEAVYGKYVEKTDTLLLKSLELTDVHRHVLSRLEATG